MADFGSLAPTYDDLLRSAQFAMASPQPVPFGAMDVRGAPSPAVPVDPMLDPPAVPDDGFSARFGKGLTRYPGHVFGNLASLPQRAFETSETRRMGGEYDPGPAVETALSVMGGTGFGAPAGAVGAGPVRPVIHATSGEKFAEFRAPRDLRAGGVQTRGSSPGGESDWVWFGHPEDVGILTDLYGANVAETTIPRDLPVARWRDYDADPTYTPDVMRRILSDHADAPGVAISGVAQREGGAPSTVYAMRDLSQVAPPRWRDWWEDPLPAEPGTTFGSGATDKRLGAGLAGLGQAGERPAVTGAAIAKMPDETVAMVDPRRIDAAWRHDRNQYVGPDGAGGDPEKYARAREFLTTADQFEAPSLRMNEGGVPVFEDGRHRFAVMRDLGMDRAPVAIDPYSMELAKKYGLLGLSGAIPAFGSLAGMDAPQ